MGNDGKTEPCFVQFFEVKVYWALAIFKRQSRSSKELFIIEGLKINERLWIQLESGATTIFTQIHASKYLIGKFGALSSSSLNRKKKSKILIGETGKGEEQAKAQMQKRVLLT